MISPILDTMSLFFCVVLGVAQQQLYIIESMASNLRSMYLCVGEPAPPKQQASGLDRFFIHWDTKGVPRL